MKMTNNDVQMYLKCPICFDFYDEPKQLSCGHSFCRKCLEEIRQLYSITCAVCRKPTFLNTTGLAGIRTLPANYPLIQIVDAFVAYQKHSPLIDDSKEKSPEPLVRQSTQSTISPKATFNCGNCQHSLPSDQAWLCSDCTEVGLYCATCIIAQHRYHRKCMQLSHVTSEWQTAGEKFESLSKTLEKSIDQCRQIETLLTNVSKPIFLRLDSDLSNVHEIREELCKLYSTAKSLKVGSKTNDLAELYRLENVLNRIEFYSSKLQTALPLLITNLHASNDLLTSVEEELSQIKPTVLMQRFLADCQETTNVLFYWTEERANDVWLAGSFTNWKPTVRLVFRNQEHLATVDLPKGRHEFKFLVDGQWRVNHEFKICKDGSDNLNNYIIL